MTKQTDLRYWEEGLDVAQRWYHEEWDGSYIQLELAEYIAKVIEKEVEIAVANAMIDVRYD